MIKFAPSILSADFSCLGSEAARLEAAGGDALHIDIMDGLFVPNITLGPQAVAAVRRSCGLLLDVHLMIYHPFNFIERFAEAGAGLLSFHLEATEDVEDTLEYIRKCNMRAGLALNPETSVSMVMPYLDKCDLVLCMSVNPGFGGQKFMPQVLEKIEALKQAKTVRKLDFDIQVDGGLDLKNAQSCIKAGADFLVSGDYLFNLPDMAEGIKSFKALEDK